MNIAFSRRTFISTAAVAGALTAAGTLPAHRDLAVSANGFAQMGGRALRCATGRGGIRLDKREGDGATPQGRWRMRGILYRADRMAAPASLLPRRALRENDGWCDAPSDARYNRSVKLPYPASAEALWRTDHLYDLIVVLGFNDAPVVRGAGSAIFLHIARENYAPTAGCIAFKLPDILAILSWANKESCVVVKA
jgi:L,D-peptidoglycan transpeptidase YkuD (ErfK/YbiS/YcfS/YnhG family)